MKKILIIGNGFDFAHLMPTRYMDFGYFATDVISNYNNSEINTKIHKKYIGEKVESSNILARAIYESIIQYRKYYAEFIKNRSDFPDEYEKFADNLEKYRDEISNRILRLFSKPKSDIDKYNTAWEKLLDDEQNNIWRKYFFTKHLDKEETALWSDFENEIENVIKKVDETITEDWDENKEFSPKNVKEIFEIDECISGLTLKKIIEDWKMFVSCFENYIFFNDCLQDIIHDYVTTKPYYDELKNKNFDKIISFNYTDSYTKYYKLKEISAPEKIFIHGKVTPGDMSNLDGDMSIIMGYSEHDIDISPHCRELTKLMCKEYLREQKWHGDDPFKLKDDKKFELYVWGHSLNNIDKPILEPLFEKTERIHLYYYSKEHKNKLKTAVNKRYNRFLGKINYIEEGEVKFG